jgi:hypothetical protein
VASPTQEGTHHIGPGLSYGQYLLRREDFHMQELRGRVDAAKSRTQVSTVVQHFARQLQHLDSSQTLTKGTRQCMMATIQPAWQAALLLYCKSVCRDMAGSIVMLLAPASLTAAVASRVGHCAGAARLAGLERLIERATRTVLVVGADTGRASLAAGAGGARRHCVNSGQGAALRVSGLAGSIAFVLQERLPQYGLQYCDAAGTRKGKQKLPRVAPHCAVGPPAYVEERRLCWPQGAVQSAPP